MGLTSRMSAFLIITSLNPGDKTFYPGFLSQLPGVFFCRRSGGELPTSYPVIGLAFHLCLIKIGWVSSLYQTTDHFPSFTFFLQRSKLYCIFRFRGRYLGLFCGGLGRNAPFTLQAYHF